MNIKTRIFKEGLNAVLSFLFGNWKRWLFSAWILVALSMWFFSNDPLVILSGFGVLIVGVSSIIFWHYRIWLSLKVKEIRLSAKQKFIIIGALAAAWVELEFWVIEKLSGVSGIAASSNFFLDLFATMPWYILMMLLLWKVVTRYSYSFYVILIYGGIYDFFADGILGTIINTNAFPPPQQLVSLLISFPVFVITYSLIVLAPVQLLRDYIMKDGQRRGPAKYFYGFLPLLGLAPYVFVLIYAFLHSGK